MCFGISDHEDGIRQPNNPRYSKPKDFKASILKPRSPNNQAARLSRQEKEAQSKLDIDPSEMGGQVRHPRHFSYVGHADEDIVRKQNTTFEGLAKRGVIPQSALEP